MADPDLGGLREVAGRQPNLFPFTDIDQLITISGMVIRTSQLIPEMQEAFFQCQVCAHTTRVEMDRGRIAEPCTCAHCHTTHSMALIHNRSLFSDKQMVCGHSVPRMGFPNRVQPMFCLCLNPQPNLICQSTFNQEFINFHLIVLVLLMTRI